MCIKNSLLFSFILIHFCSTAQNPKQQGLLWKITGNELAQPSYLYGTMHVSNKVAFHLNDSFYKAIASVDVVALEINPETWMQTMTTDEFVANKMGNVFSAREDFSDNGFYNELFKLQAPTNKEIAAALNAELGILNSLLYRTDKYGAEFQEDTYLDLFIYQAGKKQGKQITGLEQLGTTMRLSEYAAKPETDKEKIKASKATVERRRHEIEKLLNGKNFDEVMEDAYRNGDLNLLDSLSRLSSGTDAYHNYIIVHRNKGMADAMDSIMQKQALFAGIGAAHLPNSYGVIEILRQKGYTVQAVNDEKTDFGQAAKETLEQTFITHSYTNNISFDSTIAIQLPGNLYEFPESNNTLMAAYPDMANGATYVLTRLYTFAPLYGLTQAQYLAKIDSLLFENIPGKLITKKEVSLDGVPGFEITNQTKKGDFQHYFVMVRPLEIVVYNVGGKKNFVRRKEVAQSFQNFGFIEQDSSWHIYSPKNNAYHINMPGTMLYEAENTAFERGFWKKTVQSYSRKSGYFLVLNRGYSDLEYIEEDSFELSQLCRKFADQFSYETVNWNWDSAGTYPTYSLSASKIGAPSLQVKALLAGNQYYLLAAQTDDAEVATSFFESFRLEEFSYTKSFSTKQDSSLYFSVVSPTEAEEPQEYENFYYYQGDEEADLSHEEEQKTALYYSKSTDEAIRVNYKKFHKYFSVPTIDSLWEQTKWEVVYENSFFIKSEKIASSGNVYMQEMEIADTNSQRTILVKNILKEGVMYSLITEIDNAKPRSKFVENFYSTFSPWDTSMGQPILQHKANLFLIDLKSNDSTTQEAAYRSFSQITFENADAPKIIVAYGDRYPDKNSLQIRAQLLAALGGLDHTQILPFLEKTYRQVGDSIQFQIPILSALAQTKSVKSAKLFASLITGEAPLSTYPKELSELFAPFVDSVALTKVLFPKLLKLASLPEYKSNIYALLAAGIKGGAIKPRSYKKYIKEILWEATNELKRQKAKEATNGLDYFSISSRNNLYTYGGNLNRFMTILMPFYTSRKVLEFYNRLEDLKSPAVKMDYWVLKQQYYPKLVKETWALLAQSPNDRIEVYRRLQAEQLIAHFPKSITMDELVLSLFAQKASLNLEKDSLVLVQKTWLQQANDSGYVYFFKSKTKLADNWEYGYIGLIDSANQELPLYGYLFEDDFGFSKFEEESIQLRMQLRMLEMSERKRYSVSDEPEFKNLQTTRSRYNY